MSLYLLDTDHATALFRNNVAGKNLAVRLQHTAQDDYGTTIISFEEQVRGWLDVLNRRKRQGNIVGAYSELNGMRLLYQRLAIWQYDERAEQIFQSLVKANVKVGTQDLRIAAVALANDATLLTCNSRDFGKVFGLRIEDWTATL